MITTINVKRSFAKSAKRYALHAGLQLETSRSLVEWFAPDAPPKRVLDVGCGPGFAALAAAEKWPGAEVVAMDLAPEMAAEARRGGLRRVVAADAAFLPFKPGVFDGVVSSLALQWVIGGAPDFFRELSASIKKGGFLCFSLMAEGTLAELRNAYSEACAQCTGQAAVFPSFPNEPKTSELLREAGFGRVRSERRTVRRGYKSVDELFGALKGVGATAPARPSNPPRRDVLRKTKSLYPSSGGMISATYEICFFSGVKN
ncbi:MAG: methyltransferase domain-containing protein [Nitrospinae bacterium]|nr:methyltransferase domain-containing protein [Nitrospinota bacterium]